jgi:hypothetical protein
VGLELLYLVVLVDLVFPLHLVVLADLECLYLVGPSVLVDQLALVVLVVPVHLRRLVVLELQKVLVVLVDQSVHVVLELQKVLVVLVRLELPVDRLHRLVLVALVDLWDLVDQPI